MTADRVYRCLIRLAIACLAPGCARPPVEFVAPGVGPAKAALVASLDAWKAGRRASGVTVGSNPAIGIVDSGRSDRPLLDYEVVGPLMVVGKTRPFAVRLVLGGPEETVSTRYVVTGQDPLWVFRQEDFERMLHWEHRMDGPTTEAAGPPVAAQ